MEYKTPAAKRAYFKQWYQRNRESHLAKTSLYAKEYRTKGCWDRLAPHDIDFIKEHSQDMRPIDIARALGCTSGAIHYQIKKLNLPKYKKQI